MNKQAELKITRERINLMIDQPFFGQIILGTRIEEDNSIQTLCTDGFNIWYNPEFVNNLSSDLVKSAILHETYHIINKHHLRLGARDHKKFNRATDYAINLDLKKSGYKIGDTWLLDTSYEGMYAEKIYNLLEDRHSNEPDPSSMPGDFKEPKNKDGSKMSSADIKEAEVNLNSRILNAAAIAKKAGKLPGGMDVIIKGITDPVADWRTILAEFVDSYAKNDYSYSKLSKSGMRRGIISPGLQSEELGSILVVIDTSGSTLWGNTRSKFLSEVFGIISRYDCKLTLACADEDFYMTGQWDQGDYPEPEELSFKGNGGTSLAGLVGFVDKHDIDPVCCIYLSDGDVFGWGEKPNFPVIMAVVGTVGKVPEWIRQVQL